MNWQRVTGLMSSMALVWCLGACTEDSPGEEANNWDFDEPDAAADADTTPGPDADGPDVDLEVGPPGPDAEPDADSGPDPDATVDPDEGTPFTVEGMASQPFYGVFRLTDDPAITGAAYKINFREDMTVAIGFFEEVTGKWEFFGNDRVRVFELERDGQPNQPPAFPFDADLDDDNIEGLELYIPQGPSGSPYMMRLEQLSEADVSQDDISGEWQSEASYVGDNDNPYRLAMRLRGGHLGYGIYNGAYVEFAGGDGQLITMGDTGQTLWFIEPSPAGDPQQALAGEVVEQGGELKLYAPRHLNPGEEPAEFEAVQMNHVDAFRLDD